jgi:hypothetical protein
MNTEPKIEISDVEPGEPPLERAAAELKADLKIRFHEKAISRPKLIEVIKNSRDLPVLDQDYILARIAIIPEKHDILQFSLICVPHKAGFNYNFTVCEV